MTRAVVYVVSLLLALACAGCVAAPSASGPVGDAEEIGQPPTSQHSTESQAAEEEAAGFDYDGRRYELSCGVVNPDLVEPTAFAPSAGGSGSPWPLHRIRGVDPAVLVAVPNDLCELTPDQAWQSAFAADEYRDERPSPAYNEAWCRASLYGPDPAEGFSC